MKALIFLMSLFLISCGKYGMYENIKVYDISSKKEEVAFDENGQISDFILIANPILVAKIKVFSSGKFSVNFVTKDNKKINYLNSLIGKSDDIPKLKHNLNSYPYKIESDL